MAPEVKMMRKYSFTADIYSLAMTLFEMFNEQLILTASDEVKQFIMAVMAGRIGDIPASCKVPVHLHDVIKRGWRDNPQERPSLNAYQSALQG